MHTKNYITNNGYLNLKQELQQLLTKVRPHYVNLVTWAASNGDRSENADYQYSKKKLRDIDKRIHQLIKKLENIEVINSVIHMGKEIVYFGAKVTLIRNNQTEQTLTIVGQDEIDPQLNHISWTSPIAKAMLGKNLGDNFYFISPQGHETIEIIEVSYE